MKRLLVIEPNLMLRYGLATALPPDYLVQFFDALPEGQAPNTIDGMIIDAAMLRQGGKPLSVDLRAIDHWRIPTVWIDDREPDSAPDCIDRVTVKLPLQRECLLKALFDCLNPATGSKAAARKVESGAAMPPKPRARKTKEPQSPVSAATQVIELVEVVEDAPENG